MLRTNIQSESSYLYMFFREHIHLVLEFTMRELEDLGQQDSKKNGTEILTLIRGWPINRKETKTIN